MKRALIFDMDGTIVDNMAYHTASWVEFFRRRGRDIDEHEFFLRTAGRQGHEIMREYIRADLSDTECAALNAEKEEVYRELYQPHRKTVAGFDALVAQAKSAGIILAVATSAPPANIVFTLDGLDIRRHFDAVVGAADVKRGKPEPDVFLKAAEACGTAPENCIVFEDAPLGVEAARRAGMPAIALTTTLPADAFEGFDNLLATAADLTGIALDALWVRGVER
ncbi:MAG TPA: HAD family phosphatase [Noviherbaspirillum sp.]